MIRSPASEWIVSIPSSAMLFELDQAQLQIHHYWNDRSIGPTSPMTCILYREFPQKAQEFLKMPRTFLALLRSFAVGTSQVMRAAEFGVLWRDPILVRGQKALALLTCDTHRSVRGASTANRTRPSMPLRSAGRPPEKMPNLGRPAHVAMLAVDG